MGNCVAWYFIAYKYYSGGFFSNEFNALIFGGTGLVFGAIGGAIAGGLISKYQLSKIQSVFVGVFIIGLVPLVIFLILDGGAIKNAPKEIWYSIYGQFVTGGVAGLLISTYTNFESKDKNE